MVRIGCLVALWAAGLAAQTPLASFDVASVRLIPDSQSGLTSISPQDSPAFTAHNVTLPVLISLAYGIDSDLVSGKPSWLDSQQYDVEAKWDGGARLSFAQLRPALQKLLAERFQLAVHRQTKEGSGYALVVTKSGPTLHASQGGEPHSYILKNGLDLRNASMDALAGAFKLATHRAVVNETKIDGAYDISIHYAPDGATDSNLPSLFTAVREQLGLQLVSRKVPVEALVIDRVERNPTEN